MKKELVEEALTNIDDRYIEEALTYKKSKICLLYTSPSPRDS